MPERGFAAGALVVASRCANIAPVAVGLKAQELFAAAEQGGEQVLCKVKLFALRNELHCARGEDINAGVHEIGHDAPPVGLFYE